MKTAKEKRIKRHIRVRAKVAGTAARPRLCLSLTANNMYVQFIDDDAAKTLVATSTLSADFKALNLTNQEYSAFPTSRPAAYPGLGRFFQIGVSYSF